MKAKDLLRNMDGVLTNQQKTIIKAAEHALIALEYSLEN